MVKHIYVKNQLKQEIINKKLDSETYDSYLLRMITIYNLVKGDING